MCSSVAVISAAPRKPWRIMPAIQAGLATRTRLLGARRVEMIKRWPCRTEMCCGGRNAGLVRGIVGREQKIGFRQILHVNKSIGRQEPLLDAGTIRLDLALGRDRP